MNTKIKGGRLGTRRFLSEKKIIIHFKKHINETFLWLQLELPYEEIRKTGERFSDDQNNLYEFTSFSEVNREYDLRHPTPAGPDHQYEHVFSY